MTGYGRAEGNYQGIHLTVELRSINSRFFEFSSRLPKFLANREEELKNWIYSRAGRGRVSLSISGNGEDSKFSRLTLNKELLRSYVRIYEEIVKELGVDNTINMGDILHLPDLISLETIELTDEEILDTIYSLLDKAVVQMKQMQRAEGEHIERDFKKRLKRLEKWTEDIQKIAQLSYESVFSTYKERITALLKNRQIENSLLNQEVALIIDRMDVTEECVRLRSHIEQFQKYLKFDEPVGKRLNFLLQEMNREANTVGAKAYNAQISQIVVEIKNEIEKIREQVQNIQ
jgi:uncharacterized protein (TIGR00255 family)